MPRKWNVLHSLSYYLQLGLEQASRYFSTSPIKSSNIEDSVTLYLSRTSVKTELWVSSSSGRGAIAGYSEAEPCSLSACSRTSANSGQFTNPSLSIIAINAVHCISVFILSSIYGCSCISWKSTYSPAVSLSRMTFVDKFGPENTCSMTFTPIHWMWVESPVTYRDLNLRPLFASLNRTCFKFHLVTLETPLRKSSSLPRNMFITATCVVWRDLYVKYATETRSFTHSRWTQLPGWVLLSYEFIIFACICTLMSSLFFPHSVWNAKLYTTRNAKQTWFSALNVKEGEFAVCRCPLEVLHPSPLMPLITLTQVSRLLPDCDLYNCFLTLVCMVCGSFPLADHGTELASQRGFLSTWLLEWCQEPQLWIANRNVTLNITM